MDVEKEDMLVGVRVEDAEYVAKWRPVAGEPKLYITLVLCY